MVVFFDVDGTLLDHDKALATGALAFRERFDELRARPREAFLSDWRDAHERNIERYERREIDFTGQRRGRVRDVFGRDIPDEQADEHFEIYLDAYEKGWELYDDARPCLAALSDRRLAVITNGDSDQQRRKLKLTGIEAAFETVTVAGDLDTPKPDPKIFLAACDSVGVSPNEAVYVGDRLDIDARAARRVGMRGIWVNRSGDPMRPDDVTMIATLDDLPRLVR